MAMNRDPARVFCPRWPSRDVIRPARVAFAYDRVSDTLFVDFFGRSLPAVSVPTEGEDDEVDVYLRVDAESEAVVGLQIEGVVVGHHRRPWIDAALALAEQRGNAREAVPERDRGTGPVDKRAVVDALFDAMAPVAV